MKHKEELATYLGCIVMAYDHRLDKDFFMSLIKDYEQNHEGKTLLSDHSLPKETRK